VPDLINGFEMSRLGGAGVAHSGLPRIVAASIVALSDKKLALADHLVECRERVSAQPMLVRTVERDRERVGL
jgi:hypothetical protein